MTDAIAAWLAFLGISDCTCQWRDAPRLGPGRVTTDPACPHHGQAVTP